MLAMLTRRLISALLLIGVLSLILFAVFEADKDAVAGKVLGPYASAQQRQIWLQDNGYMRPLAVRYGEWLADAVRGDFGRSIQYQVPVADVLWPRLGNTAILAGVVFAVMIPLALTLGILAGAAPGSVPDRTISIAATVATAIPEFAMATFLTAVLVFWLGWLPGTSAMIDGFAWSELVLPALVLIVFDAGYVIRMTRAAMADVMASDYIRTAVLKGLPAHRVIVRHALRNALVAPLTILILQINWLLSGAVVVEVFFAYKGFGKLLLDAALFGDIYVLEACALIAAVVAVASQLLSDLMLIALDPKVRRTGGFADAR